jgi:peroxiredoxin
MYSITICMKNKLKPSSSSLTLASSPLKPGRLAPDFTPDQTVSLSQFRGRPTILAFYHADFSPVCGDEMTLYNEVLSEFQRFNAELLRISVDGVGSHLAFSKNRNLHFPILSDFEPKGAVAKKYGVYHKKDGISERALFGQDMKEHGYAARVREDFMSGARGGVNDTPTFFINGIRYDDDSWDESTLETSLRNAI